MGGQGATLSARSRRAAGRARATLLLSALLGRADAAVATGLTVLADLGCQSAAQKASPLSIARRMHASLLATAAATTLNVGAPTAVDPGPEPAGDLAGTAPHQRPYAVHQLAAQIAVAAAFAQPEVPFLAAGGMLRTAASDRHTGSVRVSATRRRSRIRDLRLEIPQMGGQGLQHLPGERRDAVVFDLAKHREQLAHAGPANPWVPSRSRVLESRTPGRRGGLAGDGFGQHGCPAYLAPATTMNPQQTVKSDLTRDRHPRVPGVGSQ